MSRIAYLGLLLRGGEAKAVSQAIQLGVSRTGADVNKFLEDRIRARVRDLHTKDRGCVRGRRCIACIR
jgi:hypothetical protein